MSGVPRRMEINTRVTYCTGLNFVIRKSATISPRGREKTSVSEKMAKLLPRPSLIFAIMAEMVILRSPSRRS